MLALGGMDDMVKIIAQTVLPCWLAGAHMCTPLHPDSHLQHSVGCLVLFSVSWHGSTLTQYMPSEDGSGSSMRIALVVYMSSVL